ncbi:MAG: hypothetical protein A4E29_01197 [Methanomassiliicoccales archaeon PtaB.Bin134]|nr:MAG: hypothetical protein A4E29_01197 [Methanomassiliicoccales archaeon PtaB.Bin134]
MAFMVTVMNLTFNAFRRSTLCGRFSPLVLRHSVRSGNSLPTSSRVRNVSSFARGSPGPAMPMTDR